MKTIEVVRLKNILDRLEAGESKGLLLQWIERQVKVMGEIYFQQWLVSDSSNDLDQSLLQRFRDAILAHLLELDEQFMRQNGVPLAQSLIEEGYQLGTDFSSYNGSLIVSTKAKKYLLSIMPPEGFAELQLTSPAL